MVKDAIQRSRVAVVPEHAWRARRRLFALMSELYPVDFEPGPVGTGSPCIGLIAWEGARDAEPVADLKSYDLEHLIFACPEGPKVPRQSGSVEFTATELLDPVFRGQTMVEEGVSEFSALRLRDHYQLVCSLDSQPYWIIRRMGQASVSVVALGPEEIAPEETGYTHFNRQRWLQWLPLLHFLKRIGRRYGWEPPPLRACLMIDDPNLHWLTYGFIDLSMLARHAREWAYHVALAMVPFDAWYARKSVVELAHQNRDVLSLCMHGNNHTRIELGAQVDDAAFLQLFAQGLRRIGRFEERTGVLVGRIMVPPYGAFQQAVAAPMLSLGYEAACVSRASLMAWNKTRAWKSDFGHGIVEFIDGLPVIPRHVLKRGHEGAYRLAAFVNQPIIPHGHHQDCAGGFALFADVANAIHGMGNITWMDMTAINRSNFLTKRFGDHLIVRMLSRRVTVPIPDGVTGLVVERPWIEDDERPELLLMRRSGHGECSLSAGRVSLVLPGPLPKAVELVCPPPSQVDYRRVPTPAFKLKTAARRILAETRDRLVPFLAAIRRR